MRNPNGHILIIWGLAAMTVILFVVDLSVGSVSLPIKDVAAALTGGDVDETTQTIVIDLRLCKGVMALLCGAALSVSGLLMQTLFRNPLAGPYVLGISSGASLAVALYILGAPLLGTQLTGIASTLGMAGAAWIGSAAVLLIILIASRRLGDIMIILILGIMLSSGIGAVVQILQYMSEDDSLKSFIIWTMGSLGNITLEQLPIAAGAVVAGLVISSTAIKPLNLMLLGDDYALTMGVNLSRTRLTLFAATTLLAGTVTAFCGPIGFIGLAMPHVARMMMRTADHRVLIPASALTGASVMLVCDIVSKSFTLPVNAITALIGIPLIIWIVLTNR